MREMQPRRCRGVAERVLRVAVAHAWPGERLLRASACGSEDTNNCINNNSAERRVCVRSGANPGFYELVGRSACNLYDIRSAFARMAVKRGHEVPIHPCVDSTPAHARIRPRLGVWLPARRSLSAARSTAIAVSRR